MAEKYHGIPEDDIETPELTIYSLDIEVAGGEGFPDIERADQPVVLISIKNCRTKSVVSFGEKVYYGTNTDYRHYANEKDLLEQFFNWMNKNAPDVITGWNSNGFDLPYLMNRTKRLFGQDTTLFNRISPVNMVNTWKSKGFNSMNIDIAGVYTLDYMDLYKWYSPHKLERYSLDFVSNFELEKGKIDYSEYFNGYG